MTEATSFLAMNNLTREIGVASSASLFIYTHVTFTNPKTNSYSYLGNLLKVRFGKGKENGNLSNSCG